jgi:ADP-glucose pyrophosphorylase
MLCTLRCALQNALIIGADYYESEEQRAKVLADGGVPLGIGSGSSIKNCIVDKNARIGKNVVIENKAGVEVRPPLRQQDFMFVCTNLLRLTASVGRENARLVVWH